MRIALKIAYDGRSFFGLQRQPDRRTVEGECLTALRMAKILRDPVESFFRSASRTDRGVSAVGNVIAFDSNLRSEAVVGAFNDKAEEVWAWACAEVPDAFHPRHAVERWYRYHLYEPLRLDALRKAGSLFAGTHDFRSFTSDPPTSPLTINRMDVARDRDATLIDVRAPRFRRGMVRRIVGAMVACARGQKPFSELRAAIHGKQCDFGAAPPEPLFLMDVSYGFPFRVERKPKAVDEWRALRVEAALRQRWILALDNAATRVAR